MGEPIVLANARIEVEERPGYLFLVEHGRLATIDEVLRWAQAMDQLSERTRLRRALIDARTNDPVEPPREVREAIWRFLASGRAFDQIAFVMADEMRATRTNMTALSQRAAIKAFVGVQEAHRWLTGRARSPSQTLSAVPTNTPVPPPRASTPPPPPASSTGRYAAMPNSEEIPLGRTRSSVPPTDRSSRMPTQPGIATSPASERSSRMPTQPGITRRSDVFGAVDPDALPSERERKR